MSKKSGVKNCKFSIRVYLGCRTLSCHKSRCDQRAPLTLLFCHYNYCRRHSTLNGLTPAMVHGLTTEVCRVRKMLDTVAA
jgi:hypothetical protein